jgi:hypothetical protein
MRMYYRLGSDSAYIDVFQVNSAGATGKRLDSDDTKYITSDYALLRVTISAWLL